MDVWGVIFVFLIFTGLVFLLVKTGGVLNRAYWFALFVGVGLDAGLAFWLFGASEGSMSLPRIGLELGGGAAVGTGFMIIAWRMALSATAGRSASPFVVVRIPLKPANPLFFVSGHSDHLLLAKLVEEGRLVLVQFAENAFSGTIDIRFLDHEEKAWLEKAFRVDRSGRIREAKRRKGQ